MAMSSIFSISYKRHSFFALCVKNVQGFLAAKRPELTSTSEKSHHADQAPKNELFSPLDPHQLAPKKKYPLAGLQYLPGSDGKGFPQFLEVPRQGLPQAYKIQHADQLSIAEWAQHCRKLLDEELTKYGVVLLRGLPLFKGEDFSLFAKSLGYSPMGYEGGTADRPTHNKEAKTFLSSAEPKEINMEPHNEMAYWPYYPQKVIFHCNIAPAEGAGGLTPIARNSDVLERLDPKVVQKLEEKQIRYIRTLTCEGENLVCRSWQSTFRTHDAKEVEKHLEDAKLSYKWNKDGSLFYWRNLPAVIYHPLTGEKVWFNQVHTHNCAYYKYSPTYEGITLESDSHYPTHTTYGDGTEIEPEVLQHIRDICWKCTVGFEWKKSDTLFLDNLQCMHARLSYTGDRRILAYLTSD